MALQIKKPVSAGKFGLCPVITICAKLTVGLPRNGVVLVRTSNMTIEKEYLKHELVLTRQCYVSAFSL